MLINSNFTNNTSFGSIYKYNVTKDNESEALSALTEFQTKEMKDNNGFKVYSDYLPFSEISKTGIFEKVHLSVDDKYDSFIETLLLQNNINYTKQTHEDAILHDNIYDRIVLSDSAKVYGKKLVGLNTAKIEELFKKDMAYISPNGEKGSISNRYEGVKEYLLTGRNINATEAVLTEDNGELKFTVLDGRHRFSVMRDMGMHKVKMALSEDSAKLAEKYGLIE